MVDFHSHILPEMDDGSDSVGTSLTMLRESRRQGVDLICATSHFYADEEDPTSFLARRDESWALLKNAMGAGDDCPHILLGAEVLYFPGISGADEVRSLCLQDTPFLLIELPMMPWSETMLDEIELCGKTLRCVPVIAHLDRYQRVLRDKTLFDRVRDRRILVQVNASYFLHRDTREEAIARLRAGRFHFVGTDCHDLYERRPNLGDAVRSICSMGAGDAFAQLDQRQLRAIQI